MEKNTLITSLLTAGIFYGLCYYFYNPQISGGFLQTFFSELVFLYQFKFFSIGSAIILVLLCFSRFRTYALGILLGIGIPLILYLILQLFIILVQRIK